MKHTWAKKNSNKQASKKLCVGISTRYAGKQEELSWLAQWIRPQALNHEVSGSNLLGVTVVPLGKALYPHCLVPQKGLKVIGAPGCLLISSLLSLIVTRWNKFSYLLSIFPPFFPFGGGGGVGCSIHLWIWLTPIMKETAQKFTPIELWDLKYTSKIDSYQTYPKNSI